MDQSRRIELWQRHAGAYRCPVCGAGFSVRAPGVLACENGHSFDIAAKGYVNFLTSPRKADYDKQLFQNRRRVFEDGFYAPPLRELERIAARYAAGKERISVLDAGCGEGYYAAGLARAVRNADVLGMDIEKEAVRMAAAAPNAQFFVGDLARIPLADTSMDIVLNVLSPAHYGEFRRVLKPGGLVVKVVPGAGYLNEIRAAAGLADGYSNERMVELFDENLRGVERKKVRYQMLTTPGQAERLFRMTPMTRHSDMAGVDFSKIGKVTVEVEILVGSFVGE